jgi:hypothetical protein
MSAGASAPLAQAVAGVNRLVLSAQLVERGALRYTPAGLPAFDLELKNESQGLAGDSGRGDRRGHAARRSAGAGKQR